MAGNERSGRKAKPKPPPATLRSVLQFPGTGAPPLTRGMPPIPIALIDDALATQQFMDLGALLDGHGLMAHEFSAALETLALVSADYLRLRAQFNKIKQQAFYTEQRMGRTVMVETPMLRRLNEMALLRMRLLGEFGLSPAQAVKVFGAAQQQAPDRKWDRLAGPR